MSDEQSQTQIRETKLHFLKGSFPQVETYPHVNTDMLYDGDDKPFHITLAVAEIGATSHNGLIYDQELVTSIARQLSEGAEGMRGHPTAGDEGVGFPTANVFWIGHLIQENLLWAKGYIPPGEGREDLRRRMATNGGVGTSIYGTAQKELVTEGKGRSKRWYARGFVLEQLDLVHSRKASLPVGRKYGAVVTSESIEEGIMPDMDNIITAADVPQDVREQIVREAQISTRVAELEQQNSALQAQVAEAVEYKQVVAEIRATLGKDTDTVQIVQQYHQMATALAEMMGVPFTDITIRVSELHQQVEEARKQAADASISEAIANRTNWKVTNPAVEKRVTALRAALKSAVLRELNGATDAEQIGETVNRLWDAEFSVLAEGIVQQAGGPPAVVPARDSAARLTPEQIIEQTKAAWNIPPLSN